MKKNFKIIVFISVQLLIVMIIIFLVLFAGKKYYTVTFDDKQTIKIVSSDDRVLIEDLQLPLK